MDGCSSREEHIVQKNQAEALTGIELDFLVHQLICSPSTMIFLCSDSKSPQITQIITLNLLLKHDCDELILLTSISNKHSPCTIQKSRLMNLYM